MRAWACAAGAAAMLAAGVGAPAGAGGKPPACAAVTRDMYKVRGEVATHTDFAKDHFRMRMEAFAGAPLGCGEIVMLGDSLTELNDWTLTVPGTLRLRNRGISGDTSDGLLTRLDEITGRRPGAVFLMIGTNDLQTGNVPAATVANVSRAVRRIREASPGTMVVVQTVLPVRWEDASNDKVRLINLLLKREGETARFAVLDTYALLVDREGKLDAAYTDDGLHLNPAGYAVWSALLTAALRQYGFYGDAGSAPGAIDPTGRDAVTPGP